MCVFLYMYLCNVYLALLLIHLSPYALTEALSCVFFVNNTNVLLR